MYINGEFRDTPTGKTIEVTNPATGEVIKEIAAGGREETLEAVKAAKDAFAEWKWKTGRERGQYLDAVAHKLRQNRALLAETITKEMGKPLPDAQREVDVATDYVEWYAEEAKRVYGETIPASQQQKHLMVIHEPVGVTAAITPWNFPVSMITRKIAPAIAAGCTVVLKPAPSTPLSAIEVFRCFHEAKLPKGVANLVIGPAEEIGATLTQSPDVRKLTFTGSTEVGKKLIRDSADSVKKISMELGGHAPFIVFEDADLDAAVTGALLTKFKNAGQTCISTNRIYVSHLVAEEFGRKLAERASQLKIGNGMHEGVEIGPLINENAMKKVQSHVEDAVRQNGKVLCGGKPFVTEEKNGYFYEPTVIIHAHEQMRIAKEETFGPVVPVFTFQDQEEVIQRANHERYGLAAYCYTGNLQRAFHMMKALDYGIVGINDPSPVAAQAPFGGFKESGIGREGGRSGIQEFLEEKFVSINTSL
ncbi:succinate-semialdehyde dehydrogenase/glutarate-semialdehyde dehydrogenase [Melghirimyces profundicolus]|uniref:Succinate-semialdehyde dehydrogenase/glutarate-semialdehyde dehydrogenase n=1 Tax=Melghirimyces profundicolus TaxID=1242148 RepID=A0A2T6BCA2_9BACL|nr:NAD-dependent succinate-semialdehyde dehydrogenase [Melghirimyces profundicolus]PTX53705.1 succinate-semialdehyde dehydrogenase/glutarate-semialdehyde dehydrogenase [Melghirimyces profundicolus]